MKRLAQWIGRLWLGGLKYSLSRQLAGKTWKVGIEEALKRHGLTLANCQRLEDVVDIFRGRWRWRPDPAFQLWDRVYPPVLLLERGGDDCDGWAGCHAQAIAHALGSRGWQARIVSYLADPWWMSHHFAVAIDPDGQLWAVQPQASENQRATIRLIHGPFQSVDQAASYIAAGYRSRVVWYDLRLPDWTLAPSPRSGGASS